MVGGGGGWGGWGVRKRTNPGSEVCEHRMIGI